MGLAVSIDLRGLAVLMLDVLILGLIVLKPMSRNYDDSDRGAGSIVLMTPPLRPSYARCGAYLAITFVVSALIVGLNSPDLIAAYHSLVTQLLLSVIPDPSLVDGFTGSMLPVFQVSVVAFGVAFALCFHASVARRVMILLNVILLLAISAVVDVFFGIFVLTTGFPLGPTPVVGLLVQYTVAAVVLFRLAFTTFQLPKKTPVPLRRGSDWSADIVLVISIVAAIAVTACTAVFLILHFGQDPLIATAIVFACAPYLMALITVFLGLVRLVQHRPAQPSADRPPIDVITPAYNEELVITDLLESIDKAAERYQGPVRVILCDDGSTDATHALAEAAMRNFRFARGEIIDGGHKGKAAALNQALSRCAAEYVFRVDADCTVHPEAFLYSVPYFQQDPKIGMVGALTLPKEPYTTWFDRMRLFEMTVLSGFLRPASDVVDGVVCIPGTFTAFRRRPALEIGGFADGIYGEDADFTLNMARLGYRVQIDTRIRSYEDVPNTQRQLRSQRTRWNRGGTMVFSRFVPVVTGLAGPRFWFFATRQAGRRLLTPLQMTILTYLLAEAVFHPSGHVNLARIAFVLVFRAAPAMVLTVVCTIYFGKARELVWLPLRYVFAVLKHYYVLECLLSFNGRPVITPRMAEELRGSRRPRVLEDVGAV